MTRDEVLREFHRPYQSHEDVGGPDADSMADEIVRLREQLAVSESLREAQVKELSGHILTLTEALSEDGDALTTAERERDEARRERDALRDKLTQQSITRLQEVHGE